MSEKEEEQQVERQQGHLSATAVPGLYVVPNFLEVLEEEGLWSAISEGPWQSNRAKTRSIQMFGPHHNERYVVKEGTPVTSFPVHVVGLAQKIKLWVEASSSSSSSSKELCRQMMPTIEHYPDQRMCEVFVNKYKPSDSLQFHVDHPLTYGKVICGVSLLADCTITFKLGSNTHDVRVPRRSLYFMSGLSRYEYKHGMNSNTLSGDARVSLTFRAVNYSK